MKFKFDEIRKKGPARFDITIANEHGDADLTTYTHKTVLGEREELLEAFLKNFNEVGRIIDDARSEGNESLDRSKLESFAGIQLEYDKIYEGSDTPPSISIHAIIWTDDFGNEFNVTIEGS